MTDTESTTTIAAEDDFIMDLPSKPMVQYVMDKTEYKDPDYVAAPIIAARYDDPNVPYEIYQAIHGHL